MVAREAADPGGVRVSECVDLGLTEEKILDLSTGFTAALIEPEQQFSGTGGKRASSIGYPAVVSAFADIAAAITDKTELDPLLHLVAKRLCELIGIRRCGVYLRDEDGAFRGRVVHSTIDIDATIKRYTPGIEADGLTREILATGGPVLIRNAQSDPRPVRATMRRWDVRSILGVPMIMGGEVIGLFFLDNEEERHEYSPEEQDLCSTFSSLAAVAISQVRLMAEVRATLNTTAQQNAILRRAAALEDRLTNLVLEGADLAGIAAALSEETQRSCAIHNADFKVLATARPEGATDPAMVDYAHPGAAAVRAELEQLTARRPNVVGPFPAFGYSRRCLVARVKSGKDDWGYVTLVEGTKGFNTRDMLAARRIATVIALELSGRGRADAADRYATEAFTRDLLESSDDPKTLARRADYHGFRVAEPHAVILLAVPDADPSSDLATRVADVFDREEPQLRPTRARLGRGRCAIVVELPAADSNAEALKMLRRKTVDLVGRVGTGESITASISDPILCLAEFPEMLKRTAEVSNCISTFAAPGRPHVLSVADVGAGLFLLATADREESDRFVARSIGPLLSSEEPGMSDLLTTLRSFFASSRSVRQSAAALEVHENTIRYRLGRIEALTGLDVAASADDQLTAQLAMLILRLEDRLPVLSDEAGL
jgi:sugar diacid utilization regulator/GAF domain-containing protein